jgi:competence protein ComEC
MFNISEEYRKVPFVRFLVPLITGILISLLFPLQKISGVTGLLITGFIVLSVAFFLSWISDYKHRWIFGTGINILFFLLGITLVQVRIAKEESAQNADNSSAVVATVLDQPVETLKTFRVLMQTEVVRYEGSWHKEKYKVLSYFEKDTVVERLQPGMRLLIHSGIRKFRNSGNPGEFNYSRYMADRGVYGRLYVPAGNWKISKEDKKVNSMIVLSARIRQKAYQIFKNNSLKGDILAITSALVLGERDYIREEVKESFGNAGVMHVMAVSGLHVGIVYLVLYYILFFLDKISYGRLLRTLLILMALWIYAFITGLSPSVLRATTMFSFVVVGQGLSRTSNTYNSLAISAFFLLCLNPMYIRNVGFQLSYMAVFGIVFLYPKIYVIFSTRYWLLDKIWALVCVSLSAQLATFPLVLLYFHQFPNYFLISNIFAIPLVSLIIYLGFLVLLFSFSVVLASVFSCILSYTVKGLVLIIKGVNYFPLAVTEPIFLDKPGVLMLYFFLISLAIFFHHRNYKLLNLSLTFLIIFISWNLFLKIKTNNQKSVSVLNVPGISAIQFVDGRTAYVFSSENSGKDIEKIHYAAEGYWHQLRLKNIKWESLNNLQNLTFKDQNLYFYHNQFQFYNFRGCLFSSEMSGIESFINQGKIDVLILSGSGRLPFNKILNNFNPHYIVIDSSVPGYNENYLFADKEHSGNIFFSVKNEGAFIAEEVLK